MAQKAASQQLQAGPSKGIDDRFTRQFSEDENGEDGGGASGSGEEGLGPEGKHDHEDGQNEELGEGMLAAGFAGPAEKVVKPLTPEALAAFKAAHDKAGVVYISRIPPGMRPTKVRHIMSGYGEIGRVYLQPEDAKRSYLRRKYTSTKKVHFIEGWVEFKDKRVARSVAEMLNAQPIGGKKGTRWRDDIWTMRYLPKFKWNMLTEQIAHEAAIHTAQLRVELSQSRKEQREYLKNVELARVLDKRAERKRKAGKDLELPDETKRPRKEKLEGEQRHEKESKPRKPKIADMTGVAEKQLHDVLGSIF